MRNAVLSAVLSATQWSRRAESKGEVKLPEESKHTKRIKSRLTSMKCLNMPNVINRSAPSVNALITLPD
ncbi:MAG: hypothetical protein ACNA8K_14700 [Cyclonatronaceae bacterium]